MASLYKKISFQVRKFLKNSQKHPKMLIDFLYLRLKGVETNYGDVRLYGFPIINRHKGSRIILGKGLSIVSKTKYNNAGVFHRTLLATLTENAVIKIGASGMSGSILCAVNKIEIGDHCALGVNVRIYDTDFHILDPIQRRGQNSILDSKNGPVIIKDSVWLGVDAIILKGVTIEYGAVIGAGSVVKFSIPEMEVHAGNPLQFVKKMKPNE